MPGFYIDPASGSAITSTLGNILGGIATNMDPKTQAEAQELRVRTMGEDLANQKARDILLSAQGIAGTYGAANANPTAGQSGVAGTLAGAAVPPAAPAGPAPGTFGGGEFVSSLDPYARVVTGSFLNDPSMSNLATGINTGKDITTGPGTDFPTRNQIITSQSTPQHVAPGDTLVIDPTKGNVPSNVIVGGDPAASAAEAQQRAADVADANKKAGLAQTAAQEINENQRLLNIYNTLVNSPGTDDTASIVGDQIFKDLAAIPGLGDATKLSRRLGAIAAIQGRLGNSINNQLQAVQPGDPVRGLLGTIRPPDSANLDPDSFRAAMEQYQRVLQYQKDEGPIAETFRSSNKLKPDADAYRSALAAHADSVFKKQQQENQPSAPAPAPPAPAPAPAPPATPPKKRWVWNPNTGRTEPQ